MTDQEALQILALLTASYPGTERADEFLRLFAADLTALPYAQALAVASGWRHTHKWFPDEYEFFEAVALHTIDERYDKRTCQGCERRCDDCDWRVVPPRELSRLAAARALAEAQRARALPEGRT